MDITLHKSFL
uniref:Uncharacterized protein n=1 Tax=Anguilla anguilla TaxID=7936 RepID=A0A0E9U4P9_ANGAN